MRVTIQTVLYKNKHVRNCAIDKRSYYCVCMSSLLSGKNTFDYYTVYKYSRVWWSCERVQLIMAVAGWRRGGALPSCLYCRLLIVLSSRWPPHSSQAVFIKCKGSKVGRSVNSLFPARSSKSNFSWGGGGVIQYAEGMRLVITWQGSRVNTRLSNLTRNDGVPQVSWKSHQRISIHLIEQ